MSSVFKVESTLTVRYQATVPDAVRRALQLDKLGYHATCTCKTDEEADCKGQV